MLRSVATLVCTTLILALSVLRPVWVSPIPISVVYLIALGFAKLTIIYGKPTAAVNAV
jgi:hypothetical protein